MRGTRRILACALVAAATGCSGAEPDVRVRIEPESAETTPLGEISFRAIVSGTLASDVEWSVSNPGVHVGPGTIDSNGRYVAPDRIPPAAENEITVRASSRVTGTAVGEARVRIVAPPIQPIRGLTSGGTRVTIEAAGLPLGEPDRVAVTFGGVPATDVEVLSSTVVRATTAKATSPGRADVEVQVDGQRVVRYRRAFHFGAANLRFAGITRYDECFAGNFLLASFTPLTRDLVTSCNFRLSRLGIDDQGFLEPPLPLDETGFFPFLVRTADLDADGDLDVIALGTASGMSFFGPAPPSNPVGVRSFRNDAGSLSPWEPTYLDPCLTPTTIAVLTSLDGDAFPDLLVGCADETLHFLSGSGAGGFDWESSTPAPGSFLDIRELDLDGNGLTREIVTAWVAGPANGSSGGVSVYANFPGSLLRTDHPIVDQALAVTFGDFDGDGEHDVAMGSSDTGLAAPLAIAYGDAAGGFAPADGIATAAITEALVAGDFDGDGVDDLLTNDGYGFPGGGSSLRVLAGSAAGLGGSEVTITLPVISAIAEVLELEPGTRDLVVATLSGGLTTIRLREGGAFGSLPTSGMEHRLGGPTNEVWAAAVSSGTSGLAVFGTAGALAFVPFPTDEAMSWFPATLLTSDLDTDGRLDAIATVQFINIGDPYLVTALFRNTGSGFELRRTETGVGTPPTLAADLDGDGTPDVVSTKSFDPQLEIRWAAPDPWDAWTVGSALLPEPAGIIAAADLDEDGASELMTGSSGKIHVFSFLGRSADLLATLETGGPVIALHPADLDGDFRVDILAVSYAFDFVEIQAFLASDAGEFIPGPVNRYPEDLGFSTVLFADIDRDEITDVVFLGTGGVRVQRGLQNFAFADPIVLAGTTGTTLHVADYDGDGVLDVVSSDGVTAWFVRNESR